MRDGLKREKLFTMLCALVHVNTLLFVLFSQFLKIVPKTAKSIMYKLKPQTTLSMIASDLAVFLSATVEVARDCPFYEWAFRARLGSSSQMFACGKS